MGLILDSSRLETRRFGWLSDKYDIVWPQGGGLFVVKKVIDTGQPGHRRYRMAAGVVRADGREVVPLSVDYDIGEFDEEGMAEISYGGYCGTCVGSRYEMFTTNMTEKKGYIDRRGRVVIPPVYASVSKFRHGVALVSIHTGVVDEFLAGYINRKGETVIAPQFPLADDFQGRIAGVYLSRFRSDYTPPVYYIDTCGNMLTPYVYDWIADYEPGRVRAFKRKGGLHGFWTERGEPLVPARYDEVEYDYYKGFIRVREKEMQGLVDARTGQAALPVRYSKLVRTKGGGLWGQLGSVWEKTDTTGRVLARLSCEQVEAWSATASRIRRNGKYGLVDETGTTVLVAEYDRIGEGIRDGMALLERDGLKGMVDSNGRVAVPPVYGKIGYLDRSRFEGGYLKATRGFVWFYVLDKQGKVLGRKLQERAYLLPLVAGVALVLAFFALRRYTGRRETSFV